jgi:lipid-A-disaccharide synthase
VNILLVAGEVSGDQHAGALLEALRRQEPVLSVYGVGGERSVAAGMRLVAHQKDLAVVGVIEAIGKIRFARKLIAVLVEEASRSTTDAAILIDSPDFNIPLAKRLVAKGVPVFFFVSPQVWAWRSGRARTIARLGTRILVLFGFEKRWYDERGLGENVVFVGHPLVDDAARELSRPFPPPAAGRRRVVLMPGSREGEIRRILPLFRDAVALLVRRRKDLEIVLIKADSVSESLLQEMAGPALSEWSIRQGPHLSLLAASDLLLVASGTATIEGVLARIPMVVVYRLNVLSFLLGKLLIKVKNVAMANILSDDGSGRRVVPELIQGKATPFRIAAEAEMFLDDPQRAAVVREALSRGATDLGPGGAPERAAAAILSSLRNRGGAPA